MLVILDGWGLAPAGPANAVSVAKTPNFDFLWSDCAIQSDITNNLYLPLFFDRVVRVGRGEGPKDDGIARVLRTVTRQ